MIEVNCNCTELAVGLNPIFNSGNGVGVNLISSQSTSNVLTYERIKIISFLNCIPGNLVKFISEASQLNEEIVSYCLSACPQKCLFECCNNSITAGVGSSNDNNYYNNSYMEVIGTILEHDGNSRSTITTTNTASAIADNNKLLLLRNLSQILSFLFGNELVVYCELNKLNSLGQNPEYGIIVPMGFTSGFLYVDKNRVVGKGLSSLSERLFAKVSDSALQEMSHCQIIKKSNNTKNSVKTTKSVLSHSSKSSVDSKRSGTKVDNSFRSQLLSDRPFPQPSVPPIPPAKQSLSTMKSTKPTVAKSSAGTMSLQNHLKPLTRNKLERNSGSGKKSKSLEQMKQVLKEKNKVFEINSLDPDEQHISSNSSVVDNSTPDTSTSTVVGKFSNSTPVSFNDSTPNQETHSSAKNDVGNTSSVASSSGIALDSLEISNSSYSTRNLRSRSRQQREKTNSSIELMQTSSDHKKTDRFEIKSTSGVLYDPNFQGDEYVGVDYEDEFSYYISNTGIESPRVDSIHNHHYPSYNNNNNNNNNNSNNNNNNDIQSKANNNSNNGGIFSYVKPYMKTLYDFITSPIAGFLSKSNEKEKPVNELVNSSPLVGNQIDRLISGSVDGNDDQKDEEEIRRIYNCNDGIAEEMDITDQQDDDINDNNSSSVSLSLSLENSVKNQIIKNPYSQVLEEDYEKISSIYEHIIFLKDNLSLRDNNKLYSIFLKCFISIEVTPVDSAIEILTLINESDIISINLEDSKLYNKKKLKKVSPCYDKNFQPVWNYIILFLNNVIEGKIGNELLNVRSFMSCCIIKLILEIENAINIYRLNLQSSENKAKSNNLTLFKKSFQYSLERLSLSLGSPILEEHREICWLFCFSDNKNFGNWNSVVSNIIKKFRSRIIMENVIELLVNQYQNQSGFYDEIIEILKQFDYGYLLSKSPLESINNNNNNNNNNNKEKPTTAEIDEIPKIDITGETDNIINSNNNNTFEFTKPKPIVRQNSIILEKKKTIINGHRVDMGQKKRVAIDSTTMLPLVTNSLKRSLSSFDSSYCGIASRGLNRSVSSSDSHRDQINYDPSLFSSVKKSRVDSQTFVIEATPMDKIGVKSMSDEYSGKDYLTYSNSFDRLSFSPFTQTDQTINEKDDNNFNYNAGISDYNINESITSYRFDETIQRPIVRDKLITSPSFSE